MIKVEMLRILTHILDFFYPPFKRWMSKEVYYYLACGTINTCCDWVMYFIIYNFIIQKQFIDLGFVTISPHISSLIIVTPITFFVGFCFSKYITFRHSKLETTRQVFRYAAILGCNWLVTYFLMKVLVEMVGVYPTPSKMITTVITTLLSFILQKYYSFRSHESVSDKQKLG